VYRRHRARGSSAFCRRPPLNGSAPQRVLMVNKFHYARGGAELYMFRLSQLLEQKGLETLFFAMRHERNEPCATDRFFPSEVDFGEPQPGVQRLRAAARALYSLEARRNIGQLLEAERVDLAHLHNVYHQLSPSILAPLKRRGIPVVMTVHDYKLVCPVYTLLSHGEICERCVGGHFANAVRYRCNRGSLTGSALVAGETWLHQRLHLYQRGIDLFVTPSSFARDKLIEGGYPAERIQFLPNFVDPERFNPSYTPGSYFLYSGRLSDEKGVDVLLQAAHRAGVALKIAGEGPAESALRTMAQQLSVNAQFLGYLEFDALAAMVAGARAVVVPSRWHENCPLTVLESMAWGKAIIGTQVGGMPELIRQGEEGVLVPPGDADALAAALTQLESSSETAERMGRRGRQRIESAFTPDAHFAALRDVYSAAAERGRNGSHR
jgi:glycosyltransferase involved in cell wall biosynthesis